MRAEDRPEGRRNGVSSYIFGKGEMPGWLSRRVMCFRKADGSIGYEIDNGRRKIELHEGDLVICKGEYVKVERATTK